MYSRIVQRSLQTVLALACVCAWGWMPALGGGLSGNTPKAGSQEATFVDPKRGFSFDAPAGMQLKSDDLSILGTSPTGRTGVRIETFIGDPDAPLEQFASSTWNEGAQVASGSVRLLTINGLKAVTAILTRPNFAWTNRLVIVRSGATYFRLNFTALNLTPDLDRSFLASAGSFQRLPASERKDENTISRADPQDGFVKERTFVHPRFGYSFSVPEGFALVYNGRQVIGARAARTEGVLLERGRLRTVTSLVDYFSSSDFKNVDRGSIEALTINGLEAATATANGFIPAGKAKLRIFVIRLGPSIFRLVFTAHDLTPELDAGFRASAATFRALSPGEAMTGQTRDSPALSRGASNGAPASPQSSQTAAKPAPQLPLGSWTTVTPEQLSDINPARLKAEGVALVLIRAQYETAEGKRFDVPKTFALREATSSGAKLVMINKDGAREERGWGIVLLEPGRYAPSRDPVRLRNVGGIPPVAIHEASADSAAPVEAGEVLYLGTMVLVAQDIFAKVDHLSVRDDSEAAGKWMRRHLPDFALSLKTHLAPQLEHIK